MIQAVGVGSFVSYGVFFNSLIAEFSWSRGAISGASSLALFLSGFLAIFVGRLNDVYGPRILLGTASVFFGTGLMLMSQVHELWQLYLFYGVIFGIGLSGVDVIALTTTARWFSYSRGIMTGIVKVGTGAGQFLVPFVASLLIVAYGWRNTSVILGVAGLLFLFFLAWILRRDPAENVGRDSADRMDGAPLLQKGTTHNSDLGVREAMRTPQMWLICGVNMLVVFTLMIVLVHIVPHAGDTGLSALQAAGTLSTIGAVSMFGRFVSGLTIDKSGSKYVMIACFFILISSLLWLQVAHSLWALYLFAAVYGIAHGGFFTAISPLVAETFGTKAHGAIFGIVVFSGTTGGAIGPTIAGFMFDVLGSYVAVFWIIEMLSCIGLALILFLRPITVNVKT
jgi:MFS family permease